jgi:hypothetical protein
MPLKAATFIAALILLALNAAGSVGYPKSFVERALRTIPTPAAIPAHAASAEATHYISLVNTVRLPGADAWTATQTSRPRNDNDGPNWPLILFITGTAIVCIGFVLKMLAADKDKSDPAAAKLDLAGLVALIAGGATVVTGIYIKAYGGGERKSGNWWGEQ